MKQLAPALMLLCVVGTHAWADARVDCFQREDRDLQLKGCTRYIQEQTGNLAKFKELAIAHFARAAAYLRKGDKDLAMADRSKAMEHLAKAIELDPRDAEAYRVRGLLRFRMGEYDRTIADFTKLIELESNAPARLLASNYRMRGTAYEKAHYTDLAIADFRRALALNPDQPRVKEQLIRLGATP